MAAIPLKVYGIFIVNQDKKLSDIPAMTIRCKTDKVATGCIEDYKRIGRLEGGHEYVARRLAT